MPMPTLASSHKEMFFLERGGVGGIWYGYGKSLAEKDGCHRIVPASARLPAGHLLCLLLKMATFIFVDSLCLRSMRDKI